MIQKIPGLQDLWQCEIFGCYFLFFGKKCSGGAEGAPEACRRAQAGSYHAHETILNKIWRAELPLPSPPRVSCAAI